jgi:hypothetical protein
MVLPGTQGQQYQGIDRYFSPIDTPSTFLA